MGKFWGRGRVSKKKPRTKTEGYGKVKGKKIVLRSI